jgi:sugar lactone lactonase YvrE
MKTFTAAAASSQQHRLAEGPAWDAGRQRVLWVDIDAGQVFEGRFDGHRVQQTARHDFPGTVGAVVSSADGMLLVAAGHSLVSLNRAGGRHRLTRVLSIDRASRLNDGACDPAGRFLIGSLALVDDPAAKPRELLGRQEFDGSITVLDADLALSNGLAWSPSGSDFYSIDTLPGIVWVRSYDPESGRVGEREVLLQLDDLPDGMCVDIDGNLWIAIWGAGQVRCYSPTGTLLATVFVPAPNTTSVAFIGPHLDTLLITTASKDLTSAQLQEFPDSGRLFTVDVGTSGLPTTPWHGDPVTAPPR